MGNTGLRRNKDLRMNMGNEVIPHIVEKVCIEERAHILAKDNIERKDHTGICYRSLCYSETFLERSKSG